MTAIARIYTGDSFIIAADGRLRGIEALNLITDEAQKVFALGTAIGYSMSGAHSLACRKTNFDFRMHIAEEANRLSTNDFESLVEYLTALSGRVTEVLTESVSVEDAILPARIPGSPAGEILDVFFDGYFKGEAKSVTVTFRHDSTGLLPPLLLDELPGIHFVGSAKVVSRMDRDSNFLEAYRPSKEQRDKMPLDENMRSAIQLAVAYIAACASPEGQRLDPEIGPGIGGRIHVARITPRLGFRWVKGLEPTEPNKISRLEA